MKTAFAARLVAGCMVAAAACGARAQSLDKPMLLVAAPGMAGLYSSSVMVVVPKGDGHVGFIINHPSQTTVASAFPDEPDSAKVNAPIYFGGPREAQLMYAALRRDPGEGAVRMFGDLFVTVSGAAVDRIIHDTPGEARYFAGFVGWGPGELAEQVEDGDWLLAEPDEALLFDPNPGAIWAGLLERLGKSF